MGVAIQFKIYSLGKEMFVRVIDHNGSAPQARTFPEKDAEPWEVVVNSNDDSKEYGSVGIYVHRKPDGPHKVKHDGDIKDEYPVRIEDGDLPEEIKTADAAPEDRQPAPQV